MTPRRCWLLSAALVLMIPSIVSARDLASVPWSAFAARSELVVVARLVRAQVLAVARADGIPTHERSFSLSDAYAADEAFVTGTYAGVVPVTEIDGRRIGDGQRGAMTVRLQTLYQRHVDDDVAGQQQQESN